MVPKNNAPDWSLSIRCERQGKEYLCLTTACFDGVACAKWEANLWDLSRTTSLHVSMRWGLCQNDWKRIQGPSCADLFLITTEFSQCYIWTSARLVCLAMTQNFRLLLVYGVCILFFWAKRSYTENMDPIDILPVLVLSWNWAMWNYMDAPFYSIPVWWHSACSIQSVNKVSPKRLPTV